MVFKKVVKVIVGSLISLILFSFLMYAFADFSLETAAFEVFENVYDRLSPETQAGLESDLENVCEPLIIAQDSGENLSSLASPEKLAAFEEICNSPEQLEQIKDSCSSIKNTMKINDEDNYGAFLELCTDKNKREDAVTVCMNQNNSIADIEEFARICSGFDFSTYDKNCNDLTELSEVTVLTNELEAELNFCNLYTSSQMQEICESINTNPDYAASYSMTCDIILSGRLDTICDSIKSGSIKKEDIDQACEIFNSGKIEETCNSLKSMNSNAAGGTGQVSINPDFEQMANICRSDASEGDKFLLLMNETIKGTDLKNLGPKEGLVFWILNNSLIIILIMFVVLSMLLFLVFYIEGWDVLVTAKTLSGIVLRAGIFMMIIYLSIQFYFSIFNPDMSYIFEIVNSGNPEAIFRGGLLTLLPILFIILKVIFPVKMFVVGICTAIIGLALYLAFKKMHERMKKPYQDL